MLCLLMAPPHQPHLQRRLACESALVGARPGELPSDRSGTGESRRLPKVTNVPHRVTIPSAPFRTRRGVRSKHNVRTATTTTPAFLFHLFGCVFWCARVATAHSPRQLAKIRVKNREPVPVYAMEMDPHERDSDIGDDSPMVSAFQTQYTHTQQPLKYISQIAPI